MVIVYLLPLTYSCIVSKTFLNTNNQTKMKTINKAKLISYLLVNSLTSRTISKTNREIAEDLGCKTQDVQWWLNVLMIDKQIHVWEKEGTRFISMFEECNHEN